MSTTTYRAVKVQLHTPVEGQSYKSVSWQWRVETSPLGAYLTDEDGKPLEFDTKAAAEVAAFDADPHAWTDENGMRYRCKRCHEPMLSILPTELTSGVCRCGGLIEADPRNFADIDPALYGLPQDSEIGAPAGWDVAEPGPEQEVRP